MFDLTRSLDRSKEILKSSPVFFDDGTKNANRYLEEKKIQSTQHNHRTYLPYSLQQQLKRALLNRHRSLYNHILSAQMVQQTSGQQKRSTNRMRLLLSKEKTFLTPMAMSSHLPLAVFVLVVILSSFGHGFVFPLQHRTMWVHPLGKAPSVVPATQPRQQQQRQQLHFHNQQSTSWLLANTLSDTTRGASASEDNNDKDDSSNRTIDPIAVSTARSYKKTRPVRFIMTPEDINADDDDDPLTLLERNQQELSLSLGKLKASLQQEQQKSLSLQERLEEAERIIAYQKEKLEQTTVAQQQELKTLDQQLAQSLLEQQQQQQEVLLNKAKQEAQKEQQQLIMRVQQLQSNLDTAAKDMQSTNKEITDLSKDLLSAQSQINQLSNRLENAVNKERSYQVEMQKVGEKLRVARSKLGVKQEILFKTQRELAQAKAKLDLQEKLSGSGNGAAAAVAAAPAVSLPLPIFGGGFNLGGGMSASASKSTVPSAPAPAPLANKVFVYPVINDWSINPNSGEVTGTVQHHPDIEDGTRIVTSALANPRQASNNAVVVTKSGSKYKLGKPLKVAVSTPAKDDSNKMPSFNFFATDASITVNPSKNALSQPPAPKSRAQELQQKYSYLQFPLTGESFGNGRGAKYLLAGKPKRKPSGRSEIVMAYKANTKMEPIGDAFAVKMSTHKDKLDREYNNYLRLQKGIGGWGGGGGGGGTGVNPSGYGFVRCYDFLPVLEGSLKYAQHSALILERGVDDLREYKSKHGTMDDATTKAALLTAIKCVESLHKARLVYTDLKAENLITMDQGENDNGGILFKGVDLESAISQGGNPLDYTPEASPPEFAIQYLQGEAYDFVLEYSYDVWSFGMLAFELATGQNFFSKKQPVQIMKHLGMGPFKAPDVDGSVEDSNLCDLINKCLHLDPKQRPTATQIANHPYFRGDAPRLFRW
jgi:hypothetical protein